MKKYILILLLLPMVAAAQDTLDYPQVPLDTMEIVEQAAETQGSQEVIETVTEHLSLTDAFMAVVSLLNGEYIIIVIVTYYFVITRIAFIKTNTFAKRNMVIFGLTVLYGLLGYYLRGVGYYSLFVSGLSVNAFYELFFKGFFRILEKVGVAKLPEWYVEEVKVEHEKDNQHVKAAQKVPKP